MPRTGRDWLYCQSCQTFYDGEECPNHEGKAPLCEDPDHRVTKWNEVGNLVWVFFVGLGVYCCLNMLGSWAA